MIYRDVKGANSERGERTDMREREERGGGEEERGSGCAVGKSSLRENLIQESKHFGNVQLHVFQVQKVLIVFLLQRRKLMSAFVCMIGKKKHGTTNLLQ